MTPPPPGLRHPTRPAPDCAAFAPPFPVPSPLPRLRPGAAVLFTLGIPVAAPPTPASPPAMPLLVPYHHPCLAPRPCSRCTGWHAPLRLSVPLHAAPAAPRRPLDPLPTPLPNMCNSRMTGGRRESGRCVHSRVETSSGKPMPLAALCRRRRRRPAQGRLWPIVRQILAALSPAPTQQAGPARPAGAQRAFLNLRQGPVRPARPPPRPLPRHG